MFYDRKIRYLNYYEAGERVRGSGFVKLEARDKDLRLEITVKSLRDITGTFPILLSGGGREKKLDQLNLQEGFGEHRYVCRLENGIGETGISYSELTGIRIPLAEGREIACLWGGTTSHLVEPVKTQPMEAQKKAGQKNSAGIFSTVDMGGKQTAGTLMALDEDRKHTAGTPLALGENRKQTAGTPLALDEDRKQTEGTPMALDENRKRAERNLPDRNVEWKQAVENLPAGDEKQMQTVREPIAKEHTAADYLAQGGAERPEKKADETVLKEITAEEKQPKEPQEAIRFMEAQPEELEKHDSAIEWIDRTQNRAVRERGEKEAVKMAGQEERNAAPGEKTIRLQEDKWKQLCNIYPHIKPFRDEREYLSISPADFVLLPAADYRAAHNSFLLHGYYNYHHLILTRVEKRGEILYYLGVPGNYYEREKQVAVMFGFESFECADEPAEYGDFGYYMMRTNI